MILELHALASLRLLRLKLYHLYIFLNIIVGKFNIRRLVRQLGLTLYLLSRHTCRKLKMRVSYLYKELIVNYLDD